MVVQMDEGVRVIFARKGPSADQVIERLAYRAVGAGDLVTVATSDHSQSDMVRGMGGAVISATELERRMIEAEEELGRRVQKDATSLAAPASCAPSSPPAHQRRSCG